VAERSTHRRNLASLEGADDAVDLELAIYISLLLFGVCGFVDVGTQFVGRLGFVEVVAVVVAIGVELWVWVSSCGGVGEKGR
jgi:hypothetical protein